MSDERVYHLHELTTKVRVEIPARFHELRPAARLTLRVDTFIAELHPGHEAGAYVHGRDQFAVFLTFVVPAAAARQPILNKLNDAISEILN